MTKTNLNILQNILIYLNAFKYKLKRNENQKEKFSRKMFLNYFSKYIFSWISGLTSIVTIDEV